MFAIPELSEAAMSGGSAHQRRSEQQAQSPQHSSRARPEDRGSSFGESTSHHPPKAPLRAIFPEDDVDRPRGSEKNSAADDDPERQQGGHQEEEENYEKEGKAEEEREEEERERKGLLNQDEGQEHQLLKHVKDSAQRLEQERLEEEERQSRLLALRNLTPEEYLQQTGVSAAMEEALGFVARLRPSDPLSMLSEM